MICPSTTPRRPFTAIDKSHKRLPIFVAYIALRLVIPHLRIFIIRLTVDLRQFRGLFATQIFGQSLRAPFELHDGTSVNTATTETETSLRRIASYA